MAVVDVAIAVGAAVGLEGAAAVVGGGAILGAGIGAGYSLLTGDGNVLNSALTGAAIGGAAGGIGAAAGAGATTAGGIEAAAGATPALQASGTAATGDVFAGLSANAPVDTTLSQAAANSLASSAPATVQAPTASTLINTQMPASYAGDAAYEAQGLMQNARDASTWDIGSKAADIGKTALTSKDLLNYGLAGSAAMSLLGGQKPRGLSGTSTGTSGPQMIRPYTYAQTKNPNYGQPGQPYFIQSYTAQTPYKAAAGGLMAIGGGVGNMYPQSQQEHTNFATPTQMPTSAEVVNADFDTVTDPYTGQEPRYAEGGLPDIPQMPPPVQPARLVEPTTTYTQAPQAPTQLQQQIADYNRGIAAAANQEYNVMPAPLANLPGGGQGASREDLNKIINQYYVKNLGRQGEQSGLDAFSQQVQQGTSLADINKNIANSPEGVTYSAYTDLLGRRPDEGGMQFWQKYIQEGHTPQEIRDAFMKSPEYLAKHPAPVTPTIDNPVVTTGPGITQADIDAYRAAHPTDVRTYNPVTQTYNTPVPTTAEVAAWKKELADAEALKNTPVYEAAGGLLGSYSVGGQTYNLGSYSDGGRLLKGPGDGMSDNIPATIAQKQPARLADGEFVVPADVVSHLGNGSTDAGAKRLYSMMDNVRKARTGNKKQGKQIKANKYLPT